MPDRGLTPPARSRLREALEVGRFALTAEVTPPVAACPQALLEKAEPLRGLVDAINVTDGARAKVHMSSLAAAAVLADAGLEPVLQMTCRDRNRIALEADLLGAWTLGISNVMILRGDNPPAEIDPAPKPVFDMDSVELVAMARRLADEGATSAGNEITSPPRLLVGVADMPVDPAPGWKPESLMAKAAAGARFAQTQFCFDIGVVRRYLERLDEFESLREVGIIVGIGPIASARSARWMKDNLFGTRIPDAIISRIESAEDQRSEGISICAELIDELSRIDGVAGAHLMAPLGGSQPIAEAIRLSGIASGAQPANEAARGKG